MTVEEIKATVTMDQVLDLYSLKKNRRGFVCCPFHHEKTPSMKITKDHFKCFGCHENGDIFEFVEQMNGCSFKEAFIFLGGTYETDEMNAEAIKRLELAKKKAADKKKKLEEEEQQLKEICKVISLKQKLVEESYPLSDRWTKAKQDLFYLLNAFEGKYVDGVEGVDIDGTISRHK